MPIRLTTFALGMTTMWATLVTGSAWFMLIALLPTFMDVIGR